MGSEARARLGLVFLLFITLFAFSQVYGEGDYTGPSLLAMAFSIGLAMGMRRLGAGAGLTLLASVVGLVSYLSWIFEGRQAWFLIPTGASVRGLVSSVQAALDKASIDFAPVPVRPGYVILTAATIWILSALGEIGTFRWRRPLVASIGCVIVFSFVMVVGSREGAWVVVALFLIALFTYWSLEAAHRLRSWGSWVTAWREEHSEPPVLTHATARRMGASSLLIALVVPLFMPALGDAVLSWKSGEGSGTGPGAGASAGATLSPLVSIAPQIVDQAETELFIVTTDAPTKWRLNTLDELDGDVWRPRLGNLTTSIDVPTDIGELPGTERLAEFEITGLEGQTLPTRYPAKEIEVLAGGDQEDLRMAVANNDISVEGGVEKGLRYRVRSFEPNVTFADLRKADATDESEGYLTDLPNDEPLPQDVIALRDAWIEGARTDIEKLVAIQNQLRGPDFVYNVDIGREQEGEEPPEGHLAHFLLSSRTGYCQQFATAFALLARSLDFRTRIAIGFLPGDRIDPDGDRYRVKGTDAHAWPEVFFEGVGWIAFEPTPRTDRAADAPLYTDPDGGTLAGGPDGGILGGSAQLPGRAGEKRNEGNLNPRAGREEVAADVRLDGGAGDEAAVGTAWKRSFGHALRLALLVLLLFLIAIPSLKELRIRRRYHRATSPARKAAAAFAEFEQEASELAAPRDPSETAPSYARRVTELSNLDDEPALRLAAIYERAEYGGDQIAANIADEAVRIAHSLRSSLWKSAGWWQRALRLFSPTGLRSGV